MPRDYEISGQVAEEVRALIARRRVSTRELADALGLSEATTYRRLSGESAWEIDEVAAAAEFFGVPVLSLFGQAVA